MEIYRYSNIHEPIPLTIFYFTSKFINDDQATFLSTRTSYCRGANDATCRQNERCQYWGDARVDKNVACLSSLLTVISIQSDILNLKYILDSNFIVTQLSINQ